MEDLRPGCVVQLNDGRKGICRYAGKTHFIDGDWVGVELEEPTGKNDGLVAGERYFECEQDYGLFVKRAAVAQVLERPPKPQQSTSRARAQTGATAGDAGTRRPSAVGAQSRHSVSTASPSPASRAPSQQRAGLRSPVKSPTKQLTGSTANRSSIGDTSRTPAAAAAAAKARPRTSTTTNTKAPMGPPPAPATRRPSRPSLSGPTKQPSRQSLQGGPAASKRPPSRPSSRQVASKDINTETESGQSDAVNETDSPDVETEDQDNESPTSRGPPQPPAASRTMNTARQRLSQPMVQRPVPANTSNKDVDEMKTKVKVMEKKRAEDRDKLQTLERLQAERDKFEGIIQKLQTKYQPQQAEIGELRKKLKDAEARVDEIEGVLAEHDSAMEMATLDREMAEETADSYKTEAEALKLKLEELQLELDVLRDENEEFGEGTSPEDRSNQNWLQTEKHNERLREALVRLRDMTQQQEGDLKEHIKELEQDLEEYAEIKSQFEKTKEKLLASEENVEALKQQLDTALGAEEMIEELSDKNMRYQEEINELKAAIEDLEALKEISDELESTHIETEKQLQEEIDYREGLFNEQCRRISQQDEVVDDLEYTLVKFRELVSTLQGDLEDMRASQQISEAEASDLTTRSRAMIDLNMKLQASAAKTQTKTIEVELGQLEAQEAIRHLSIAKLYLPEYYESERNSVLALLRFERVSFKASLMNNTIREKTSNQSSAAMSPEDFFLAHDVLEKLLWITSVCDLFVSYISSCSSESFSEIKGTLFEMEPVERTLNFWIELLKKDEVNMEKCATELQRSIALLSHLAETMLPSTPEIFSWELCMWTSQTQSYLDHSASCVSRLRALLQSKITVPEEGNEEIPLFFNKMDSLSSQARGLKVAMGKVNRAVSDFQARSLALPNDKAEPFQKTEEAAKEVSTLSRQFAESIMELVSDEGRTEPLTLKEALDSLSQTSSSHAQASDSESEGSDALSLFGNKLRAISSSLEELDSISSNLSLTTEFERRPSPWIARAEELKSNKTISPDADEEIRRVKAEIHEASTALGVKDKTIEEQAIKVELVESRMREASKKASMVKDLEAKIEQAQAQEADLVANIERQRKDLEAMESERNELKSRMDRVKRASGTAGVTTTADGVVVDSGVSLATMYENETLRAEVQSLQAAVRFLREENRRMQMLDPYSVQRAADLHSWLDVPLTNPSARTTATTTATSTTPTGTTATTDDNSTTKAQKTATESKDAFMHLLKLTKDAKVCDLQSTLSQQDQNKSRSAWRPSKTKLRYQVLHQREDFSRWTEWRDDIVAYEREQDRLAVAKKERAAAAAAAAARKSRHVATGSVQEFPQGMGHGMMGRAWRILGMQSQKHGGQGMGMGDDGKDVGAGTGAGPAGDGFVEPSIMPDS